MATLPTCFKAALGTIEPDEDAANAKIAHEKVSKALQADEWLRGLGVDPVLIGSYKRDVSIKRVKDVDVLARLTKATSGLRPGTVFERLVTVLEAEFGEDRVEQQTRSIKVDFPDFDLSVDVVPARPCGDHWEIPEKADDNEYTSWIETNPTRMTELKEAANGEFLLNGAGVYVWIVKLVRQVRRIWVVDRPAGYYAEVLTYWAFQDAQPDKGSVAEYLTVILEQIAENMPGVLEDGLNDPTMNGETIATKATDAQLQAAAQQLEGAAKLAREAFDEPDKCQAAVKWRKLLGKTQNTAAPEHVFPLPPYCDEDGSTKNVALLTQGAPTVPAGDERYA